MAPGSPKTSAKKSSVKSETPSKKVSQQSQKSGRSNTSQKSQGGDDDGEDDSRAPRRNQVVFVLGGPGAGKGTQCTNVCRRMRGWATISAGDVLRKCREEEPDSKDAQIIEAKIKEGAIVPVEITLRLIKQAMHNYNTKEKGRRFKFLIDG